MIPAPILRLAAIAAMAAPLLVLAACQGEQKTAQKSRAEGEILPASANDAMLPYDTLRSQPPLAPPPAAAKGGGGRTAAETDAAADASEPSSETAASPTPSPAAVAEQPKRAPAT